MRSETSLKSAKKSGKKKDDRDPATKRLDVIIRMLMERQMAPESNKKMTKNQLVDILHSVDLTDTEIGKIIGQPRNQVASLRTKLGKAKKK